MYWSGNNILSGVDFIKSGINLHWIPIFLYSGFCVAKGINNIVSYALCFSSNNWVDNIMI